MIPDDIPFNLRVSFTVASPHCFLFVLSRIDFSQLKLVFRDVFTAIENKLVSCVSDVTSIAEVDVERLGAELFADGEESLDATTAGHSVVSAARQNTSSSSSSTKSRRKKRGARGRGR